MEDQEYKSFEIAHYLITNLCVGGFRNESEIIESRRKSMIALHICEHLIALELSKENSLSFIEKIKEHLNKFEAKK